MYLHASYWFLYPDSKGDITEIWPVPFNKMRPVPDDSPNPEGLFKGFMYTYATGKEVLIPPDHVVYLRFPNPLDPYIPLPPLRAIFKAIVRDEAQANWDLQLFDKDNGLPTSFTGISLEVPNDEYAKIRRELKRNHGQNMVGRTGAIDVQFLGLSQKEMQFLEGREFNQKEIWDALGVPIKPDKEEWRAFISNTVWPLLTLIAGQVTTQLARPYWGTDILVQFVDIRPQDRAMDIQEATQYWPHWTHAEIRAEQGKPELPPFIITLGDNEGVDLMADLPTKIVDKLLTASVSNFKKNEPPQEEPEPAQPSLPGSAGPTHAQQQEKSEAGGVDDIEAETQTEEPEQTAKATAYKALQKAAIWRIKAGRAINVPTPGDLTEAETYTLATILGQCWTKAEVNNVFAELDPTVAIKAEIGGRGGKVDPTQLKLEKKFIPKIHQFLRAQAARIYNAANRITGELPEGFWPDEVKELEKFLVAPAEIWVTEGVSIGATALRTAGLGLEADVNHRVANWARSHALKLAKKLNGTTKELAKAKIANWLATGKPFPELVESLTDVVGPKWRAKLIASTEVTRAFAEVNKKIAQELDVIGGLIWNTAHDERVCPICRPLNGEHAKKGGTFPGGLYAAPAHPGCRCGMSFWIKE